MDDDLTVSDKRVLGWLDGVSVAADATSLPKTRPQSVIGMAADFAPAAPLWVLERHDDDWTATVDSEKAVTEDCCTDGAKILSEMNPEGYQMPFGTRVVCIKTQHLSNLHIALQTGVWVTEATVGERINQVFEEHNASDGEKVLFIFSINKQKSFCALAEMKGKWKKGDAQLAGWQEARDSYKTVGSIQVTFTHVKNVANDHFDHIRHENNQQPISNMWNGMHFPIDKGREVVQVFHVQAHFTNILCRDKRKRYNPSDPVTNSQDLDPRITRHRNSHARGALTPHSSNNWRRGSSSFGNVTTPTRSAFPKQIEAKPQNEFKTPTPPQPRAIKRDNVPTPLRLRDYSHATHSKPSPRPGQIVKCIVDENGHYIPLGPGEDSPEMPSTTLRVTSTQDEAYVGPMRHLQGRDPPEWLCGKIVTPSGIDDPRRFQELNHPYALQQHQSSAISSMAAKDSLPSQGYVLRDSVIQQDMRGTNETNHVSASGSTDWLRKAAMQGGYFIPNSTQFELHMQDTPASELSARQIDPAYLLPDPAQAQRPDTVDESEFFAKYVDRGRSIPEGQQARAAAAASEHVEARANQVALHPRDIAYHAYQRNQDFIAYQNFRREDLRSQGLRKAENSSPSTNPSDCKDWASTSEIERSRITPLSPLGRDGDPFMGDSVSKKHSPTAKAFAASVNREIRNMRQGQRATPTPHKTHKKSAFSVSDDDDTAGVGVHCSPLGGVEKDGGVPIPYNRTHSDDLNTAPHGSFVAPYVLPGLGQPPRKLLSDFTAAGQHVASWRAPVVHSAKSLPCQDEGTGTREQHPQTMAKSSGARSADDARRIDKARSDLIGFTP